MNPWTPQVLQRLRDLFADGLSFELIAEKLRGEFHVKLSRNAAIGKAHRIGLHRGRTPPKIARPYPVDVAKANGRRAAAGRWANRPPKPEGVVLMAAPANPVTLVGLTSKTCRWPITGEGADTLFCGDLPKADDCYCAGHAKMAYAPNTGPKKRSANELARSIRRYVA